LNIPPFIITGTRVHIRWCIRRDLDDVLVIEAASHAQTWNEEDFCRTLRQRNVIGMVAEHNEIIVGFMVYSLDHGSLHLLDLAVHPDWRRQSIGRQMMAKLMGKLTPQRRPRLVAWLRESNLPAQLFFRDWGLRATGVAREHFRDTGEDGYCMVYSLKGDADAQAIRT
jgi:[ribosomal protein S18]-alanine N-acetyltransferase